MALAARSRVLSWGGGGGRDGVVGSGEEEEGMATKRRQRVDFNVIIVPSKVAEIAAAGGALRMEKCIVKVTGRTTQARVC